MTDPGMSRDELASLEQAIAALEGQRAVLGDDVVDTALAPLADKRRRLLAGAGSEQRKLVTVLFADLVGFTELAGRLDPEDVRTIMGRCFSAWRAAVEAEGGAVEKYIGDAVMAVFGLYRAREDDAHRAVRAALAMRDSLADLGAETERQHGVRMQMRVGVDTGEAVVSVLDPRAEQDFAVVGEIVNRAARLQAAAPPDGVLLSAETGRLVRGSFGLQDVEALRLKGMADPVGAYLVTSGVMAEFWPETRGVEGVTTRTVGRELELGRLRKLFADVVDDKAWRIVTVVGEAGVGKSRLVHDFEDWVATLPDEVWLLRGRASPTTEDVPNGLLRSVFAERLGVADTDPPDVVRSKWHTGVGPLLGGGEEGARSADVVASWLGFSLGEGAGGEDLRGDPEALRRRAAILVRALLARLAERAPVLVLLEDLHWADSASLDWLDEIASSPPDHALLIVATTRPALFERRPLWGEGLDVHVSLRLEPLSSRESRELLAEILRRADHVPQHFADAIADVAEGNPFYIEELVKWLIEQGVISTGEGAWSVREDAMASVTVPTTLRGVLQARLDSLAPAERGVVERASVVGRVFWDAAVVRLADERPDAVPREAFDRLRTREVVFERPRSAFEDTREFSFRHALMRDVAYEGVLRSSRRRYHALAASWLEDVATASRRPDEYAAAIAFHHEAAGDHGVAARWLLRAGLHAVSAYANDDALRLLERARHLAPPEDDADLCADVLLATETVLDRLGRRAEQRVLLDELASLTGTDLAHQALVTLAEGRWLFFHTEYTAAPPVAELAAEQARAAHREDLELEAVLLAGRSLAFGAEHDRARERLERALEQARRLGSHRQAGEALRLLGVIANNTGDAAKALELLDAARAEHRVTSDTEAEALVLGQIGAVLINSGRFAEGRARSQEALEVFVASGHRLRQAIVLGNIASAAIDQGELDDALVYARQTLQMTEEVEDPEGVVSSLLRCGEIHRLVGDPAAARGVLTRAVELGNRHDSHYFVANALCVRAMLESEWGDAQEAVGYAREAVRSAELSGVPHVEARARFVLGLTMRAAGDAEGTSWIRRAADEMRTIEMDSDHLECLAAWAAASLDDGTPAPALVPAVDDVLARIEGGATPGVVQPGQPFVDCHRVLAAAGDPRAPEVAARGVAFRAQRAALIGDDVLRAGFLANAVNRRLFTLAS